MLSAPASVLTLSTLLTEGALNAVKCLSEKTSVRNADTKCCGK